MPTKIRVLDEHTINKIAAGEVIENPASVVKELLDNALDAGATEICVEIKGGGRQLIRITDNGCGMDKDDALLSLERHATSKLTNIDDLNHLHTRGFRGEALPSIASISKFSLHTQAKGKGTLILVEGGKILSCAEVCRDTGTTIEVKTLFYNVPVRKKFQRSPTYDATEIQKVVTVTALAKSEVKFTLINNGKTVFATKGEERIHDLLGEEVYTVDEKKGEMHLHGSIGFPTVNRPNRTGQFLFVNGRPVHSPLMSYAVKEGYGTTLTHNRHPVFVLFLDLPPESVDINVHPQKKEVRFFQTPLLREFIVSAVDHTLQQVGVVESFEPIPIPVAAPSFSYTPRPFPEIKVAEPKETYFIEPEPEPEPIKVLSTLTRYILIEHPDGGFAFVDQRAAQARILYESMQKETAVASQALLLPILLKLTPLDAATIKEVQPDLETLGFTLSFTDYTVSIQAVPTLLQDADIETVIQETVSALRDYHDDTSLEKMRQKQLAKIASGAAKTLTSYEAKALVTTLMQCEHPFQCPLGKPTIWHLTESAITKYFKKNEIE